MKIFCSDLEGVWIPEVWINVAEKTGIEALRLTTRDVKDYDELMQYRLKILAEKDLTLQDIQQVIATMEPLPGAREAIHKIQSHLPFILVSDTFMEFADPLMKQLDYPTLLCNSLVVDNGGKITGYRLRQQDGKRKVIQALQSLNYQVIAMGDSYNDIAMLQEADEAFLFNPPPSIMDDYPDIAVIRNYDELCDRVT